MSKVAGYWHCVQTHDFKPEEYVEHCHTIRQGTSVGRRFGQRRKCPYPTCPSEWEWCKERRKGARRAGDT